MRRLQVVEAPCWVQAGSDLDGAASCLNKIHQAVGQLLCLGIFLLGALPNRTAPCDRANRTGLTIPLRVTATTPQSCGFSAVPQPRNPLPRSLAILLQMPLAERCSILWLSLIHI